MDFGNNNNYRNDNSSRSSGVRTDSRIGADSTNPRGSERVVDNRRDIVNRPDNFRDSSKEKGGIEVTKRYETIANIIIGVIGYGAGILMLLIGIGVIPAP